MLPREERGLDEQIGFSNLFISKLLKNPPKKTNLLHSKERLYKIYNDTFAFLAAILASMEVS